MTGKEYLERLGKLKQEILADQDNIAAMRSVVEQCTTHLSVTAGCNPSKNKDSFENVMLSITEAEKELEEKVKHLAQMKINIIMTISKLKDRDQQEVLRMRYIEELSWDAISLKKEVTEQRVYQIHREALANLEKIIVGL